MIEQTLAQAADSFGAGDHLRAERLCEQVLARAPGHPDALHLLGRVRLASGRAGEAIAPLQGALREAPRDLAVLDALSAALAAVGEYRQAESAIREMLAAGANLPVIRLRLGISLAQQGRWDEAAEAFSKTVEMDPGFAEAHHQLGNALLELRRHDEALLHFGRALALDPRHADAHNAMGVAFERLGRPEDAAAACRRALAVDGAHARALHNLGRLALKQGRLEEAKACLERAIQVEADNAGAYCDLGTALQEQGQWAESAANLERALAIDPALKGAEYNLALAQLHLGAFDKAWPRFERRIDTEGIREQLRKDAASVARFEALARWRGPGERGAGEIAIWAEQSIGCQLLFSTLIPELVATGLRFVYEVDARLLAAYERAFPGSRFVAWRDPPAAPLLHADRVLFTGSLPGIFRCTRESFARQPRRLLTAQPERIAHYRRQLDASGPGRKVALSWYSRRADWLASRKSVPLALFADLLRLPGMQFVDVQYGDTTAERRAVEAATGVRLLRFEDVDHLNDLEELLAILEACDLLITTSNATAHLAGVLGKRAWLLYLADNPPFHYWIHDSDYRSLWYPSVEIVTAPQLSEWRPLIERVAEKLAQPQT